ncbi:uncharacterized protein LOC132310269 [Cornus florida]|uniref:uncharacterized protein LOC132310269 n=1 Tax=Cornus florida TaxID=4283 RepID=UPI002899A396|nr:uncharacterized protein LOC132310269 [Cornus florida]
MMMAGATAKVPMGRRNVDTFMIFEFLEEGEELSESSCNSGYEFNGDDFVDEDEDENGCNVEEKKVFWESQHELLQTNLRRSSLLESHIRQATKAALREVNTVGVSCVCRKPVADGCRNCLLREISDRLQIAGYNSAICESKWRSSPDIPSGKHTYMEVMDKSNSKKREVRVVIELNFRAEFEMARASEEYNQLISRLPEVYVGKAERLERVINVLCSAAKKCMKEKKMHMAPWRKQKYMQAKWLGTCERKMAPIQPVPQLERPLKQKTSMLTFDLLENLPGLHSTAIQVV